MPASYTHYRFGKNVLENFDNDLLRNIIYSNRELYNIGLNGPDILFYYDALSNNKVNRLGHHLHTIPCITFLENAKNVFKTTGCRDTSLSYLLGFVCHFTLDRACHNYIEDVINISGMSHLEIETDFERELLTRDYLDPLRYNTASHIRATAKNASIISPFFDDITPSELLKGLLDMVKYNGLLLPSNIFKEATIRGGLKVTGKYKSLQGLIMKHAPNPRCTESTNTLIELYYLAIKDACDLMNNFYEYLKEDKPLDGRFQKNFIADA